MGLILSRTGFRHARLEEHEDKFGAPGHRVELGLTQAGSRCRQDAGTMSLARMQQAMTLAA
jgi:hypothetical protein